MYNDEENRYHYSYQKDNQPGTSGASVDDQLNSFQYHSGPQQPVQEMKPVKKNHVGLRITALALCCALLGGVVGGGVAYYAGNRPGETSVNVSSRPATQVSVNTVDGKNAMSDA